MRLWFLLLIVCFSGIAFGNVPIKIATDPWCPYVCEKNESHPGILVEIAQKALAESGYSADFVWLNWARAIKEVRVGKIQGLIGAYRTDAPDFVFGHEHLVTSSMCFYTSVNDSWRFSQYSDLQQRKVAIVNGYSYGKEFDNYVLANETKGLKNIIRAYGKETVKQRLALLEDAKVDTIIEDKLVTQHFNGAKPDRAQLRNVGCLPAEKVYLAFSPSSNLSPRLTRALDKGVKHLKRSGELARIINKYITVTE